MTRKKQKIADTASESALQKLANLPSKQKRRLFIKSVVGLGVMGVGAGALSGYDSKQKALHDLTAIGAGKPVVVQVHDTSCPTCRLLKSRTVKVLEKQTQIEYRIADMATAKGRAVQEKYGVQKTTLLLFDADGKLLDTVIGLQTIEQLERLFARRFPAQA